MMYAIGQHNWWPKKYPTTTIDAGLLRTGSGL